MSEKATVEVFLKWIQDTQNGLAAWIEHFQKASDEAKLREIYEVYNKIKAIFGF